MTARVHAGKGGHHHLAWESQALVAPLPRRRTYGVRVLVLAFLAGLLIGLMIR